MVERHWSLPKGHRFDLERIDPFSGNAGSLKNAKAVAVSIKPNPLRTGERGIIISPIESVPGGGASTSQELRADYLRMNALLWDRIEVPNNNMIHVSSSGEVEFLESAGVLQRSNVQFTGTFELGVPGSNFDLILQALYAGLHQQSPDRWAIGYSAASFGLTNTGLSDRTLLIDLNHAIPMPSGDVPLADVLEFKLKRRDELLALRSHLDDVYQKILNSDDRPLAELTEFDRLDRAIADLLTINKEHGIKTYLSSIGASFDFKAAASGVAGAVGLTGLTATSVLTGAAAGLSIGWSKSLFQAKSQKSPFEYVARLHRDLPWTQ